MAALEAVLEQALKLSDDERGELVERLLQSLGAEDGDEVTGEAWNAAWSAELDRRVAEVDEGAVELVDGDEALAQVRAAIEARRR